MSNDSSLAGRKVGLIGLGAMGSGMAGSLRRLGAELRVCDAREGAAQAFATVAAPWRHFQTTQCRSRGVISSAGRGGSVIVILIAATAAVGARPLPRRNPRSRHLSRFHPKPYCLGIFRRHCDHEPTNQTLQRVS